MNNAQKTNIVEEKNASHRKSFYSIHTFEIRIPLNPDIQSKYELFLEKDCVHNKQSTAYHNQLYYSAFRLHQGNRIPLSIL